ncbi:MAG: hypothetical protein ACFE9A_20850 [Candidatus Hodarchaeota archaeon]
MSIKRKGGKIAWKFRRDLRDVFYSLKSSRRISSRYISKISILLYAIVVVFTVFVISGGVYNVLERPLAILPRGSGWTFIYRGSIHLQTLNESIVAAIIYILGIFGLYLILRSTKLVYRPRQAYMMLMIGLLVTLISVYYSIMLLQAKIGSPS